MSTPTVLPAAALSQLSPAAGTRASRYVGPALARGALYLTPVPLALAAREPLAAVPWQVPAGALVAGWCARSALGRLGREIARGAGGGSAARLVLVGFAAVAAAWSVLLAVAPAELVGADRALAYAVSLPALALLAALTAAVVTGAEPVLLRWSVPALLVAGFGIVDGLPAPGLLAHPEALLPAAIALLAVRGFAPAVRPADPAGRPVTGAELRSCGAHLALGAGQAATVMLVWRAGYEVASAGGVPPGVLPLLVAIPMVEVWVGWHVARFTGGLARFGDRDRYLRHLRRLGWWTLVALLPPLVTGAALAGTAARLPYGLSAHPDAPALLMAMASGVFLAGVVAIGWLLSARGRPALAAAVTAAPMPVTLALAAGVPGLAATSLSGWGQWLPATAIALAIAYAAGLVLTAYVLFDPRSLR